MCVQEKDHLVKKNRMPGYMNYVNKKLVNLSFLFLAVQSVGSMKMLTEFRKQSHLVKMLGLEMKAGAGNQLKELYMTLFKSIPPQYSRYCFIFIRFFLFFVCLSMCRCGLAVLLMLDEWCAVL